MSTQASGLTARDIITLYQRHSAAEGLHGPEARADRQRTFRLFLDHPAGGATVGDLAVSECRPFHLTDFIEAHPTWKSTATRRAKANMVRAAFQWAADQERIDKNPFRSVRYGEAEPRPALPDEVLGELLVCADKRFERAARFLRLTGCRLNELCGLEWPGVDLEKGIATVEKHKSRRYTRKAKVLVLVPEAVELLKEIRRTQRPEYQGTVFLNNRNKPWTRRTLGQQYRRLKARYGIKTPASLHGLRHAFASEAVKNGAPIKLVADALGHATSAVTEKYYAKVGHEVDAIREAAKLGLPKRTG